MEYHLIAIQVNQQHVALPGLKGERETKPPGSKDGQRFTNLQQTAEKKCRTI